MSGIKSIAVLEQEIMHKTAELETANRALDEAFKTRASGFRALDMRVMRLTEELQALKKRCSERKR